MMPPGPQQQQLLDPTTAGSLWRASRLESFRDREAGAGLLLLLPQGDGDWRFSSSAETDPEKTADDDEIASLLARAAELSSELDALALRQASGQASAPWWADAEYDDARSDAANDRGVEALRRWKEEEKKEQGRQKKKKNASSSRLFFSELAQALFTEAVRLRPSSAVYCANRAAAALASGANETALEAAVEAARASPLYSKAWSLRGRALLSLRRSSEAAASFERALELERGGGGGGGGESGTATTGTKRLLDAARASEADAKAAAAGDGSSTTRPALRRDVLGGLRELQQAGTALEAAERALRAEPGRHELLRARAEVRSLFFSTLFFFFNPRPLST